MDEKALDEKVLDENWAPGVLYSFMRSLSDGCKRVEWAYILVIIDN